MKKYCFSFLTVLLLVFSVTGCSAGGGKSTAAWTDPEQMEMTTPEAAPGEMTTADAGAPAPAGGGRVYADENAKLIRKASLSIQTIDFSGAVTALNNLVDGQEGYYESAEVYGGGYYDASASRYGTYTVRIPKEHYSAFMSALGDVGYVASRSESSTDVGQEYADTEARLATLRTKHERLLSLLEQAATIEDIISLENALSETEYEIDQYSSTLKRYDGLVDYATIEISLEEVLKIEAPPKETAGFGGRMAAAFSGGIRVFGNSLSDFAVWCAYHFIGILIAVLLAFAVLLIWKKVRRRSAPPAASPVPPDYKK